MTAISKETMIAELEALAAAAATAADILRRHDLTTQVSEDVAATFRSAIERMEQAGRVFERWSRQVSKQVRGGDLR